MPYNPDFTPMKNALYEESNRLLTDGINYYVDALIEAGVPATRDALVSELVDGLPTNYDCVRAKDSVRLSLVAQGQINKPSAAYAMQPASAYLNLMHLRPVDIERALSVLKRNAEKARVNRLPAL